MKKKTSLAKKDKKTTSLAKKVEYIGDWNLLVTFQDGEKKVYICDDIPTSQKPIEKPLKDIEYFKTAYIDEYGILTWSNGVDVCPDGLYNESIPYDEWLEQQKQKKNLTNKRSV